jgi:tetratricopeptide (TPR) repeat protein
VAETPEVLSARYRIVRPLGAGGMGQVFLAFDARLERQVAVKLLPPALGGDPVARERLRREALAAASLDHPFICKVHEIVDSDGRIFIVMEYVAGETLQERLRRTGPLPVKEAIALAGELSEALEEAHARNLVHRDLKPSNVMVTPTGHVKVMDFGLAKQIQSVEGRGADATVAHLTGDGIQVGTLAYMSPEQVVGDPLDARSDIFAFGVVLLEMLTGTHPFSRPTTAETVGAILSQPPVSAGRGAEVPEVLMPVIRRMVAKRPDDRYATLREVRSDLARCADSGPRTGLMSGVGTAMAADPQSLKRTPFVGRSDERAELRRRLDEAINGRGSIVLVGGEPGVGKTRLSEELQRDARTRGCMTLVGHCYEMEGAPPYVTFIEILEHASRVVPPQLLRETLGETAAEVARLMPELRRAYPDIPPPAVLPPDQQRRFFFNAYREFVQRSCRLGPLVVLMDDLHWADEPTLALLQHVAQVVPTLPLLVIGTYRDVELDTTRPFARTLEAMLRQRTATRIPLRRLPETAVTDMLAALANGAAPPPGLAHAIYAETEGNPFFVEEVFHHLAEEGKLFDGAGTWKPNLRIDDLAVPEGVRLVISRRLERLGDDARRVLTSAAVIGRSFSLTVLEAVEDRGSDGVLDAIEEAERAHLIAPAVSGRDPRYMFAHELIRQTLSATLSIPRRQRVHLKVADAIERVHAASLDKHVSALAHHLYNAGTGAEPERAASFLSRAGRAALAAAAFEEAMTFFENGLTLEEDLRAGTKADLLDGRGAALRSLGRSKEAITSWQRAMDLLEQENDIQRLGEVAFVLGWTEMWDAQYAAGIATLKKGLSRVGHDLPSLRCLLLVSLGTGIGATGNFDEGTPLIEEAERLAEQSGDARLLGRVLGNVANHHWNYHECRQAEEAVERMVQTVGNLPDMRWAMADAAWISSFMKFWQGRVPEARASLDECEREAERLGHAGATWCLKCLRGMITYIGGEVDRALEEQMAATAFGAAHHVPWRYHSVYGCGAILSRLGRHAEAIAYGREAVAIEPAGTAWDGVSLGYLFAFLAAAGDGEAERLLPRLLPMLPVAGRPNLSGRWRVLAQVVKGLADLGDQERLAALYPLVVDRVEAQDGVLADMSSTWEDLASICARAAGRGELADAHAARARVLREQIGFET